MPCDTLESSGYFVVRFSTKLTPCEIIYLFITLTLVSLAYFVDTFLTKFDLCEFRRLFTDPVKDFLAVSLVFVF